VAKSSATTAAYWAAFETRGRTQPHWWRLRALRRHRPEHLGQLAELWAGWVELHGDDVEAALGSLIAERLDKGRIG
jgi:hypothetical protein